MVFKYQTIKTMTYGGVFLLVSHLVPLHALYKTDGHLRNKPFLQQYRFLLPEQKHTHNHVGFVSFNQVAATASSSGTSVASSSQL